MKSNIFIPKQINVGFQERRDTYTQKLAYVIYFDEKGKLRKEASWNSWRDEKIEPIIFDNEPTSGFVLNKKVGDYSTGWNHRKSYVRVYDPRNFEFEISIENLLYILENTSSIKGKGLEGDFIYGWDGKDLILIPTDSPDYKEIMEYNKILHSNNKIKVKDLIIGATYKTKSNEEWIYMGGFDYYKVEYERIYKQKYTSYWDSYESIRKDINKGKHHFFVKEEIWFGKPSLKLLTLKSLGDKFIDTASKECVSNYAELFDRLESKTEYSPYDKTKDEYLYYTLDGFEKYINELNLEGRYDGYSIDLLVKEDNFTKETIHYEKDKKEFYIRGSYDRNTGYEKKYMGDIKAVFEKYKPMYKNEYLQNGKLFRGGLHNE